MRTLNPSPLLGSASRELSLGQFRKQRAPRHASFARGMIEPLEKPVIEGNQNLSPRHNRSISRYPLAVQNDRSRRADAPLWLDIDESTLLVALALAVTLPPAPVAPIEDAPNRPED